MATYDEKVQFVYDAIVALRDPSRSQGIHTRFSGFNDAFRQEFGEDPRAFTEKMAADGKLVIQPRKGGAMLYHPGDEPAPTVTGQSALERIKAHRA